MLAAFKHFVFLFVFALQIFHLNLAHAEDSDNKRTSLSAEELYNMGLESYQKEQYATALGHWRKAVFLGHTQTPSLLGIEKLTRKINVSEEHSNWIMSLNRTVPLSRFFILALILLLLSCGLFALASKKNAKALNVYALIVSGFFLATIVYSSYSYYLLFKLNYATVIQQNVVLKSSPNSEAPDLFEAQSGAVVQIIRTTNNWVQVKKENRQVGWLELSQVYPHSGPMALQSGS